MVFKKTQEEVDGLETGTFEDEKRISAQALKRFEDFLEDCAVVTSYCFEKTTEYMSASKYIAEVKS